MEQEYAKTSTFGETYLGIFDFILFLRNNRLRSQLENVNLSTKSKFIFLLRSWPVTRVYLESIYI